MVLWNKVLSGFDADDETVNFGTRKIAESNGSIYETSTLATIQSDAEVLSGRLLKGNPRVLASIQHSRLYVIVDKSVTIFADETCRTVTLSVSFESFVSCYCVCEEGAFLVVVLEDGTLYYLYLHAGGRVVASVDVPINAAAAERIVEVFPQSRVGRTWDIALVSSQGTIYRVTDFPASRIRLVLDEDDQANVEDVAEEIRCVEEARTSLSDVISVEVGTLHGDLTVITIGREAIGTWPDDLSCRLNALPYGYVKAQFFEGYDAILCLRDDGKLNAVCPRTLLARKVFDGPIADFVAIQDKADDDEPRILALIAPREPTSAAVLRLLSFPDFAVEFEMSVTGEAYLVAAKDGTMEDVIFLEGLGDVPGTVKAIRVQAIAESLPEYRLERLLRRGKYEEAAEFAGNYRLDPQAIYRSKIAALTGRDRAAGIGQLVEMLEKIEDVEYVCECCTRVSAADCNGARDALAYARKRLVECVEKTDGENARVLLSRINGALLRLETFELIRATVPSAEEAIDEWTKFSKADLMRECEKHLRLGELEAAAFIWVRHLSDVLPKLTVNTVRDILDSIPWETPPSRLSSWLRHFVPSTLSVLPASFSPLVAWGCRKTESLEKSHREHWPQIGLDFANGLTALLSAKGSHCFLLQREYTAKDSPLRRLTSVVRALEDLKRLRIDHRVALPLGSYTGEPMDVAHSLLDKVRVDEIPRFVDAFLRRYTLENALKNDDVFVAYIQKTLNNSKGWWFWEEAPWEARLAAVVGCIQNLESRLRHVLKILQNAPVPWSPTISALAEASCAVDHRLVAEIRAESNYVAVKIVLKKYGYQRIDVNRRLISCILAQNRQEMLDDVRELTRNNASLRRTAFSMCVDRYLTTGNIDGAMNIVNDLTGDAAVDCCEEVVYYVWASLRSRMIDDSLEHHAEVLDLVEAKLRDVHSKTNASPSNCDAARLVAQLKTLHRLSEEFGITDDPCHAGREKILLDYVDRLSDATGSDDAAVDAECGKLERLADLLQLPRSRALAALTRTTKSVAVAKRCVARLEGSGLLSAEECGDAIEACAAAMSLADEDPEVARIARSLCLAALRYCRARELPATLSLLTWARLFDGVAGFDEAEGVDWKPEIEPRTDWRLYNVYADAAVCGVRTLLPLLEDSLRFHALRGGFRAAETTSPAEQVLVPPECLLRRLRSLQPEHGACATLRIVEALHLSCGSSLPSSRETLVETGAALARCAVALLRKLMCARSLDLQLGLCCLFALGEEGALKWLGTACKIYRTDNARHRAACALGHEYCRLIGNDDRTRYFRFHGTRHYWSRRLAECGVPAKDVRDLGVDSTEKLQAILERVMSSGREDATPRLIDEFCADFEFEPDDCYMLYLQVLLERWTPAFAGAGAVDELRARCEHVVARIGDRAAAKRCLAALWSRVNFYHYEVFLAILQLLGDENSRMINHLTFLKGYTRVGEPTQIELDEWSQLGPESGALPPISRSRLPFLPKVDQWRIIEPELSLATYEKWLTISPALDLQVHVICTMAVRNSLSQAWKNAPRDDGWSLYPRNGELLEDVKRCLDRMTGPEALYYATAALYHVVNNTPPGADQVAAVQECYAYAQRARKSEGLDDGMIQKIKYKYLQFTSRHILHIHGLADEKYLRLAMHPEKLARELYADESIPARVRGAMPRGPDVNAAVDALCELFSANAAKLRHELLQEWLRPEDGETKLSDSVTETFRCATPTLAESAVADDNLLRACYVLECQDTETAANFLINISFGEGADDDFGPGMRCRALQVLRCITDPASLQRLTKRSLDSIERYATSLRYSSELEALGLAYDVHGFEACSKGGLARALRKTHFRSPRALALILWICADFGVHDYSLWDSTLGRMAELSMVDELKRAFPALGSASHILTSAGYVSAWQTVLWEPFKRMDASPSAEQIDECVETLSLLHACPVVGRLRFREIIARCFHCRRPHLAAALLPFLGERERDDVSRAIRERFEVSKVTDDLEGLSTKGILTVSHAVRILRDAKLPEA